ncbi:MAG TPA: SGNH/GDSL hydrolase family protein [Candidatus Hydrogenedens sp.]|nr:SGNH/GDSL hydrolase family protein [Candidatus Hydrogenedens sp.]
MKSFFKNIILILASIFLVLVLTMILDRVLGNILPKPFPEGTHDLIFPPLSRQEFASVDFKYVVETNSLGIRDREIQRPKSAGTYRIIAVGDSYTYGWGVNIEETWLRRLEQKLSLTNRQIETVNLGKPGTGPPFYAEISRTVVPLLEPDLILVGILQGNDIASSGSEGLEQMSSGLVRWTKLLYPNFVRTVEMMRLTRSLETRTQERPPEKTTAEDNTRWAANTAKEFYEKMSPEEKQRFDNFDASVKQAFFDGLLNPYMIDLALKNKHIYTLTLNPEDPWILQCIENMAKALQIIKSVANQSNAQIAVVSIPDGPYVNEVAWKNIQRVGFDVVPEMLSSDAPDKVIQIACEKANVPCFTVSDAFRQRKQDPNLFFTLDGHLTAEGHKLLAETLAPKLQRWLTKK